MGIWKGGLFEGTKVIQKVSSDGLLKKETRIYFQTIYNDI
jgi:hypothetical protein